MFKNLILSFALFTTAFTASAHFQNNGNDLGYMITPDIESPEALDKKVGDKTSISGKICARKENDLQKCHKITDKNIFVSATFPDSSTDVSSNLFLNKSSNEWSYKFNTDSLNDSEANVLTIIVGAKDPHVDDQLKLLAKFQKRIALIEKEIAQLKPRQPFYNDKKIFLHGLKDLLIKSASAIERIIDASENVLARYTKPVRVAGHSNGPHAISTQFDEEKFGITVQPGTSIDNEELTVEAYLLNKEDKGGSKRNKSSNYILRLLANGSVIGQKQFKELDSNEKIVLNSKITAKSGWSKRYLELQLLEKNNVENSILLPFLVTKGVIPPVISISSPNESLKITNTLPQFQATVSSSSSKIDINSIRITVKSNPVNVVTNSSNNDLSVNVMADLQDVQEGEVELIITASDVLGNEALPVSRTFYFDKTKPVITSTLADNVNVGVKQFRFNVTVQDNSSTITKILHNGLLINESSLKEFPVIVDLAEGINSFEIQSIDAAQNIATPIKVSNILYSVDASPVAKLSVTPTNGFAPLLVKLNASESTDDKGIVRYVFEPLPGQTIESTSSSIDYTYTTSGAFNPKVTVHDANGGNSSYSVQLTVNTKLPPVAIMTLSKSEIFITESLSVDGTGSTKGSGNINQYSLDFGDGTIISNSTGLFAHTYNSAGTYVVKLTVQDDLSGVSTKTSQVVVKDHIGPVANLNISKSVILEGESITLDASASSAGSSAITQYHFNLGDGSTHTQANPVYEYTYESAGTYTLSVQVTDGNGKSSTASKSLQVKATVGPTASFAYSLDKEEGNLRTYFYGKAGDSKIVKAVYETSTGESIELPEYLWRSSIDIPISQPFNMNVKLTVTDELGKTNSTNLQVTDSELPVLKISALNIGQRKVLFDFRDSFHPTDYLEGLKIEYGDGNSEEFDYIFGLSVHEYQSSGTYNVKLSSTDGSVQKNISVDVIDLILPVMPPVASFTLDSDDSLAHIKFYLDQSVGLHGEITSVLWDHGDGTFYSGSEKMHTHFYEPGSYLVKLTVMDSNGLQNSQIQRIVVHESGPPLIVDLSCEKEGSLSLVCDSQGIDKFKDLTEIVVDWGDDTIQSFEAANKEYMFLEFDHEYEEFGNYIVKVTAKTSRGEEVSREETYTFAENQPPQNQAPLAFFNCTTNGRSVLCDGSLSRDQDGFITNYEWSMGDGKIYPGSMPFISHTYLTEGQYIVTLKVTDNLGMQTTRSQLVPIISLNKPPIASIRCEIDSFNQSKVNCDGSFSADLDGSIINYIWDFGNGETATGKAISHVYQAPGNYVISLKVIDNQGSENKATTSVIINAPPKALISCQETGTLTLSCNANQSEDDGRIVSYEWELSDGATYAGVNFFHEFTSYGTKNIVLTIKDEKNTIGYSSYEHLFRDPNIQPLPVFNISINHETLTIKLDASLSMRDGREVSKYIWQFDNGSPVELTSPTHIFTFQSFGKHIVRLRVIDNNSQESTISKEFKIYNMPVPDPGDAGKATLLGIDSDEDGVRDDIQRLIVSLSDENVDAKRALTSIAKNWQTGIQAADTQSVSIEKTKERMKFIRCLTSRFQNVDEAQIQYKALTSQIFNTRERLLAFVKTSKNFNGQIVEDNLRLDQHSSLCE